jgi:Lar family restriction alleviation protein
MSNDLKPCPFCGGACELNGTFNNWACWVFCGSCGTESSARDTEKEAIEAWNTRANPIANGLVPDGYALVPIKITELMRISAWNEPEHGHSDLVERIWAGALAASPSHPSIEEAIAGKRASVNAYLHERQDRLLLNMIADNQPTKEGE